MKFCRIPFIRKGTNLNLRQSWKSYNFSRCNFNLFYCSWIYITCNLCFVLPLHFALSLTSSDSPSLSFQSSNSPFKKPRRNFGHRGLHVVLTISHSPPEVLRVCRGAVRDWRDGEMSSKWWDEISVGTYISMHPAAGDAIKHSKPDHKSSLNQALSVMPDDTILSLYITSIL